jgi:hypothetical protein
LARHTIYTNLSPLSFLLAIDHFKQARPTAAPETGNSDDLTGVKFEIEVLNVVDDFAVRQPLNGTGNNVAPIPHYGYLVSNLEFLLKSMSNIDDRDALIAKLAYLLMDRLNFQFGQGCSYFIRVPGR